MTTIYGTVSWGTHRLQDLIPAFLDTLADIDGPAFCRFQREKMGDSLSVNPHDLPEDDPWWDSDEAGYLLEELFDALDDVAPRGHYFGAHQGDGSDFGFWPVEE